MLDKFVADQEKVFEQREKKGLETLQERKRELEGKLMRGLLDQVRKRAGDFYDTAREIMKKHRTNTTRTEKHTGQDAPLSTARSRVRICCRVSPRSSRCCRPRRSA